MERLLGVDSRDELGLSGAVLRGEEVWTGVRAVPSEAPPARSEARSAVISAFAFGFRLSLGLEGCDPGLELRDPEPGLAAVPAWGRKEGLVRVVEPFVEILERGALVPPLGCVTGEGRAAQGAAVAAP